MHSIKVKIRRQWNDWRIAHAALSDLSNLHWDRYSGGVKAPCPQYFIHAYVMCDRYEGDLTNGLSFWIEAKDKEAKIEKLLKLETRKYILQILSANRGSLSENRISGMVLHYVYHMPYHASAPCIQLKKLV